MRRLLLWIMCLVFALPVLPGAAQQENDVSLRALLIGCDYFLTQASTAPAAGSNVQLLAEALLRDRREYRRITTAIDKVAGEETLERYIARAYAGADDNDISLFYISTHGIYKAGTALEDAALLLSDGETEYRLTARTLKNMLDQVPGTKVLILDACNSGAFIGKGLSFVPGGAVFVGEDYKVLCSAGGSEESWYWKNQDDGDPALQYGASYFATVLSLALSPHNASDMNADGQITLQEMYRYLLGNYAASTPQVYPQEADFPLFVYDKDVAPDYKMISGLTFDDDVLLPGQKDMAFSYTLHEETRVYYQLIYHHQGAWDFDHAQMISDSTLTGGSTSPGRKMRTLSLETDQMDTAGYVMLLLITKEDDRLQVRASRLLCVQPAEGSVRISVASQSVFCPEDGGELSILVQHNLPCSLSVTIVDENGSTVRRLCYDSPSRPQGFAGSTFHWDGRMTSGDRAPAGKYTVKVETRTGGVKQTIYSPPFELVHGDET